MIQAQGLTKRYGSVRAVDGLSFDVRPGLVTGFLGPNGAGKSTTMRMILGLDRPTGGTRDGQRPAVPRQSAARCTRSARCSKPSAVHGGRSAYHHLLCLAQSNGIPSRRVDEVLELVGLRGRRAAAGRHVLARHEPAARHRRRAARRPAGPDVRRAGQRPRPEGIVWIRTLLRGLAAEGRTVFVSSHLMSEMALTADHLVVIGRGRLVADARSPSSSRAARRETSLVRTPDATGCAPRCRRAARPSRRATTARCVVTGVDAPPSATSPRRTASRCTSSPAAASLEDAYLELTRDSVDFQHRARCLT